MTTETNAPAAQPTPAEAAPVVPPAEPTAVAALATGAAAEVALPLSGKPKTEEVKAAQGAAAAELRKMAEALETGDPSKVAEVSERMESVREEMEARLRHRPPTVEQVMDSGYSKIGAQRIVQAEQRRFELGIKPYGNLEERVGANGAIEAVSAKVPQKEVPDDPLMTIRGRMEARNGLREKQGTLDDVRIIVAKAFDSDRKHTVGEDVTELALTWPNTPMLLKRGYLKSSKPVDFRSIQLVVPPTRPDELAKTKLYADSQADIDAQKVLKPRPPKPPPPPVQEEDDEDEDGPEDDFDDQPEDSELPPEDLERPRPPAQPAHIAEDGAPATKHPALAANAPTPPAEGGLNDGLKKRLADLQPQDSAKHIKHLLKEAGAQVPDKASKTQMLAIRDALLAA